MARGSLHLVGAPGPPVAPVCCPIAPAGVELQSRGTQLGTHLTLEPVLGDRWWAPLASAALPGAGQLALRQRRFVPYLAVEAFAWVQYVLATKEGRDRQREYQDIARAVARAAFSERPPVGNFEYYERMEQYVESGVFDLVPGGVLEPEVDTTTFNGATWLLARRTYWESPATTPPQDSDAFRRAHAFYTARAVRPAFRWSWRNAQLEQDLFRRTVERSNNGFRRSAEYLGVIIANHVLSAVDAFVTLRLRQPSQPNGRYGVQVTVPWTLFEGRRGGR